MKPYYDEDGITIYHGDCREVLPNISADVAFADPPYGTDVAEWDRAFTSDWIGSLAGAARLAMAITPGTNNVLELPKSVGRFSYRWMLSVSVLGVATHGLMGFASWIPVMVYAADGASVYKSQVDCVSLPTEAKRVNHPSPKPENVMRWILSRLPDGSIVDPFMGSGTTLVEAKRIGRRAIGIEREEKYCEIAAKRLAQRALPLEVA